MKEKRNLDEDLFKVLASQCDKRTYQAEWKLVLQKRREWGGNLEVPCHARG